jgi:excisionase family DNA binding protein
MNNDNHLLTPQEVASELQLNLLTIYRYIHDKKIIANKFGRKYRITRPHLDQFINSTQIY